MDLGKIRQGPQRECQKSNRFDEQNSNSAHASCFFEHFFAGPTQLRREMSKFSVYLREGTDNFGKVINCTTSV